MIDRSADDRRFPFHRRLPVLMSLLLIGLIAAGIAALAARRRSPTPASPTPGPTTFPSPDSTGTNTSPLRFLDVTEESRVLFTHRNGASGRWYFPEIMGSGCLFFDYDDDGDVDIYLVQGAPLPGCSYPEPPTNRLLRQEADHRFTDVTMDSGTGDTGYGMGCTAGDVDADGDLDLFVTNLGPNVLLLNEGDGTFIDATDHAGLAGDAGDWSTSSAFLDYDGDGDLDLYVANYVRYSLDRDQECIAHGHRDYCSPTVYPPTPDRLYRNDGTGRFHDVTREAGVFHPGGKGLGVAVSDIDDDGRLDIYVANDGTQNLLFHNQGEGRFAEVSFLAGVGFSEEGKTEAGMGAVFGDYDGDGDMDLFVTNLDYETNTLYRNEGTGVFFTDRTAAAGLFEPSLGNVGFGADLGDLDADGLLDLLYVNGHVMARVEEYSDLLFAQRDQVFAGDGSRFHERTASVGDCFARRGVSRGLAWADFDRDGDIDYLTTDNGGPARLLRNDTERRGNWVILEVRDSGPNRHGVGCRITLRAAGRSYVREIRSGGSYLSQGELAAHFGLGSATTIDDVEVRWPDGHRERYRDLAVCRRHTLVRGSGRR